MRRLRNGGDVGADNAEKRGTTAGRGGRAVPRGQARDQAQGQAVAAGTSSRLSLLMLCGRVSCSVRGPPPVPRRRSLCSLAPSCNLYILCESVRCFSVVVRDRPFERG